MDCKFCNRAYKTDNSLARHELLCKDNPNKISSRFTLPESMYHLNDDGKLQMKIINKCVNAPKAGVDFQLSCEEIGILLEKAEIKSSDWGFSSGKKYVLARYSDTGPYSIENCRFITHVENIREKQRLVIKKEQDIFKRFEKNWEIEGFDKKWENGFPSKFKSFS